MHGLNEHLDPRGSMDNPTDIITVLLKTAVLLRVQFADFLERYDMTEGKYAVLSALAVAGASGLSQSEVADELMHSESNVSSLIDRLQQEGLVDRRWSSTDRRKRVLLLTPAGQILVERIETSRHGWAEGVLSGVSSHDRSQLRSLLSQLPALRQSVPARRPALRPASHHRAAESWQSGDSKDEPEITSPQSALEQMLSTLGLTGRFAEEKA